MVRLYTLRRPPKLGIVTWIVLFLFVVLPWLFIIKEARAQVETYLEGRKVTATGNCHIEGNTYPCQQYAVDERYALILLKDEEGELALFTIEVKTGKMQLVWERGNIT